jgi:hypothetical protein
MKIQRAIDGSAISIEAGSRGYGFYVRMLDLVLFLIFIRIAIGLFPSREVREKLEIRFPRYTRVRLSSFNYGRKNSTSVVNGLKEFPIRGIKTARARQLEKAG